MTWTMAQCLPVDKVSSLERFPYRFNDSDIETYQLHRTTIYSDGSEKIKPIDVFFYKQFGSWRCAKVKWDTVAVGYKDMNQRGCTGQFDTHRVELGRTIEEALDNFNAFQTEVWG